MQVCSDPLEAMRTVRSGQQWCAPLPPCHPTHSPCKFTNIGCDNQEASNINRFCFDAHLYQCANSQLIQRIQQKISLYQTPSSDDTRQVLQRLTNIIKQHVTNFVLDESTGNPLRERVNQNISQDLTEEGSGVVPKSRSPSLLVNNGDRQNTDDHASSKAASHHSRSFNPSLRSTKNGSTRGTPMYGGSSQTSLTPSLRPSSILSKHNYGQTVSPSSRDVYSDRAETVHGLPMRSGSSTSHRSEGQSALYPSRSTAHSTVSVKDDQDNPTASMPTYANDHHQFDNDRVIETIDSKNRLVRSPSSSHHPLNRPLSTERDTASKFEQHESPTHSSSPSDSRQSSSNPSDDSSQFQRSFTGSDESIDRSTRKDQHPQSIHDEKIRESNNWLTKFARKTPHKHSNVKSMSDASPSKTPQRCKIDQRRIDIKDLHMKEAMAALEVDLTKEAIQKLIDKKKDCRQNRLMYILSAPSRCCRSCRTQRRLSTVAQQAIDIAIKK